MRISQQLRRELTREVKVNYLESAECAIIHAVQTSAFKEELDVLKQIKRKNPHRNSRVFAQQRKTNIKTYSSLYKLDPFVDEDGILRVGGRLRRASLSDDMKFPIILPRNSHVTTLIVRYFHERSSHQGKTMTLNEVRPLTVTQILDPDSPSPLTPSQLLTMKSKVVLAPPGVFQPADVYCRKRWRRVQHLANEFWSRWRKEFLLSLQERRKWTRPSRDLQVDDVVIMKDESLPRNAWPSARVSAVYPSADGQ